MPKRRLLLLAGAAVAATGAVRADPVSATKGPIRFGADSALVDSGLARSLVRGFASDTGIAVALVPAPALAVLDAVRDGEIDVALANAPDAEAALEAQSLVYDRKAIASGEFIVVGPLPRGRGKPPAPLTDGAQALARIRDAAEQAPQEVVFLTANDGSGAHLAEQALWRAAKIEPKAPWYVAAARERRFLDQVRERGAWAVVERGAWSASGASPTLSVAVEGDPSLVETVRAMRSFRVNHPAGRIFLGWIAGRRGRAIAAAHRGYRAAA